MTTRVLISLLLVVAATLKVAATDRFFIEDFALVPGQTTQVNILLENELQYTAFQADLYLPDGVTAEEGSFALTSRKASDHTLSTSILPNGAIRLMSYSMRVNPYRDNSGALVTFQVTASESIDMPATVSLRNILFTSIAGSETGFNSTQCTISLVGDVNGDGQVNIADVTTLIDQLLNGNSTHNPAADCNRNGEVNIADVTVLIDYLLSGNW